MDGRDSHWPYYGVRRRFRDSDLGVFFVASSGKRFSTADSSGTDFEAVFFDDGNDNDEDDVSLSFEEKKISGHYPEHARMLPYFSPSEITPLCVLIDI